MVKRIITLCLCIFMLMAVFCGCQSVQNKENSKGEHPQNQFQAVSVCLPLESLLDSVTDVVKAEVLNKNELPDEIQYGLKIKERYWGEDRGDTIRFSVGTYQLSMTVDGEKKSYSPSDMNYEVGKEYIFVLKYVVGVYEEALSYCSPGGNIFLPVEDISNSTMYGEALKNHSQLSKYNNLGQLISYITEYLQARPEQPTFVGNPYIQSTDLATILKESPYVLRVELVKDMTESYNPTDIFSCKVKEVLKGDAEVTPEVTVYFFKNTVKVGDEYIIALEPGYPDATDLFRFSSKNSLFTVDQQAEILQHLSNEE